MTDTTGVPEEVVALSSPRPSTFWRVLRVLIIAYCGVLGAVTLFVVMDTGVAEYFNLDGLRRIRDPQGFLNWVATNGGLGSALLLAASCLAWAVAWYRGEGKRAPRLELFYGSLAVLMILGTLCLMVVFAVTAPGRGHPHVAEVLFMLGFIGLLANAPALMMASYVLWRVVRRSTPALRA